MIGDKLYVAGGARPLNGGASSRTIASLQIYDLKSGHWSKGPDLPTPRTHVEGIAVGGDFYVLGGSNIAGFRGQNLRTVERYDPRSRGWKKLADMPRDHWAFGLVAVGRKIIVVGGVGKGGLRGGLAAEVDVLDTAHNRWSTLPDLATPRHHFAAVVCRDRIYTIDGSSALIPASPLNTVDTLAVSPTGTLRKG